RLHPRLPTTTAATASTAAATAAEARAEEVGEEILELLEDVLRRAHPLTFEACVPVPGALNSTSH
ncbi:MAG: hypothetical protein WCJ30_15595, partial [Deltaproteobacteria bacterium]